MSKAGGSELPQGPATPQSRPIMKLLLQRWELFLFCSACSWQNINHSAVLRGHPEEQPTPNLPLFQNNYCLSANPPRQSLPFPPWGKGSCGSLLLVYSDAREHVQYHAGARGHRGPGSRAARAAGERVWGRRGPSAANTEDTPDPEPRCCGRRLTPKAHKQLKVPT